MKSRGCPLGGPGGGEFAILGLAIISGRFQGAVGVSLDPGSKPPGC
jgi:hypothetical protein